MPNQINFSNISLPNQGQLFKMVAAHDRIPSWGIVIIAVIIAGGIVVVIVNRWLHLFAFVLLNDLSVICHTPAQQIEGPT